MGKKQQTARPFFAVRGEFTESMEATMQAAVFLIQEIENAMELGQIDAKRMPSLRQRLDAFKGALMERE